MRIIFSGTPDFASICLERLILDGFEVVGVITAPDRKKGRGQKLSPSPVKTLAEKHNMRVFQPTNLKDQDFLDELNLLNPDLGVVVAFRMMPEQLWSMPALGTINLHASLLPNYRGAAPINWAIINGEKKTGLTTFFLKHEIDTGDILLQEEILIRDSDDAGTLHDHLAEKGSELLSKTLDLIMQGNYHTTSQKDFISDGTDLKKAPKIFKKDCEVNWRQESERIYDTIRGLSPYPSAWTTLKKMDGQPMSVKIFRTEKTNLSSKGKEGQIKTDSGELLIGTKSTFLKIIDIQPEGRQKMAGSDFLRGYPEYCCTINSKS
ncbi:MAG: methionyl-tRNA formyltransferase [Vicingaceae bacterium]